MHCVNCGVEIPDDAKVCYNCGKRVDILDTQVNKFDHTSEYNEADIHENKVYAMLPYISGIIGCVIAAILGKDSKYVKFHTKEAVKMYIFEGLLALLCIIPFLGWLAFGVGICAIFVFKIMQFVRVCGNKAIETPLISKIKFLR